LSYKDRARKILSLLRKFAEQSPDKRYSEDVRRLAK
jgi:hypothetical protein